jgi:hypothetical protein
LVVEMAFEKVLGKKWKNGEKSQGVRLGGAGGWVAVAGWLYEIPLDSLDQRGHFGAKYAIGWMV